MHLVSKSLYNMDNSGFLTFYEPTRQGEAARDPQQLHQPVSGSKPWFGSGCGNGWAVSDVSVNPGMIPRGNFGNSPEGGCAIDLQSQLLWGDAGTVRMKGPQQLFARPYSTTPFLGGGSIENIPDQSKVMFGHSTANRKSIQTVTDKQFPVFEPLIDERKADIPEHNYFVEPFLRGGQASRLIPRIRVDTSK